MLQVAPKHEAAKRHYYRTPPELGLPEGFTEDLLGRVESAAAAAIIRFEREKTLDLDERHWLALFLLLQHRRTPPGRRQLTFMDEYVGKLHAELRISNDDAVRSPLAAHGPAPTDEDVERWQAEKLAELERGDLVVESTPEREVALEPVGLSNRRIRFLREMSGQWVESDMSQRRNPTRGEITKLSGCGEYAADAVQIFCNGDLTTDPTDRVLLAYVNERRTEAGEHLTEIIEERSR